MIMWVWKIISSPHGQFYNFGMGFIMKTMNRYSRVSSEDTPAELDFADPKLKGKLFLSGPVNSGKTSIALRRLDALLRLRRRTGNAILVLTPLRTMQTAYRGFLVTSGQSPDRVSVQTMAGLIRRLCQLFWPLYQDKVGFYNPIGAPRFLTLETAQVVMQQVVQPMLNTGAFASVNMERNRLYSQLIDNLNKAEVLGFPLEEVGPRLKEAWSGDISRLSVYDDVQTAILAFRQVCLKENYLDFSLQVHIFVHYLWPNPICQNYLRRSYSHLIYDNAEEDPPYVHDIIRDWRTSLNSSLVIMDEGTGFRHFLGADPVSAAALKEDSDHVIVLSSALNQAETLGDLSAPLLNIRFSKTIPNDLIDRFKQSFIFPEEIVRYYPQLLEKTVSDVSGLIAAGVSARDICILTPYLSVSTLFTFRTEFERKGIPVTFQKPSTSLNNLSDLRLLTRLLRYGRAVSTDSFDKQSMAVALSALIPELDYVRATQVITALTVKGRSLTDPSAPQLASRLSQLSEAQKQHLITFLRHIQTWTADQALENILTRFFDEILSQPGFCFYKNDNGGTSTALLLESFRRFRSVFDAGGLPLATENKFLDSIEEGLISAQYPWQWQEADQDKLLICPVTTFLMLNRTVDYQYWLGTGSPGWYERLEQPLTQAFVLSRNWKRGDKWTTEDEVRQNKLTLEITVSNLLMRCRKKVLLGISEYSESGYAEQGLLLNKLKNLSYRAVRQEYRG